MLRGSYLWPVLCLAAVLLVSGCSVITGSSTNASTGAGEGFAIYLTRDDVPVAQMEALSHVAIADSPIIGPDDIVAYYWDAHEIVLTQQAYARIYAMRPPTSGTSFVVCVNRQPVYWGAFWPMYSSQSYDGVGIWVCPPHAVRENAVRIDIGYPGPPPDMTDDPRPAPAIRNALAAAGKLKQ